MNIRNKHRRTNEPQRGFTIIEVVLVLAIAGLIFLMVFLALPALQKGQRDTQRKETLSKISTQINNYSGSARGKIPLDDNFGDGFVAKYLGEKATSAYAGEEYSDPSGTDGPEGTGYSMKYDDTVSIALPAAGTVYYSAGQLCDDDNPGNVKDAKARNYTLRVQLENQKALYCLDNR